jgi:hypothetical protein
VLQSLHSLALALARPRCLPPDNLGRDPDGQHSTPSIGQGVPGVTRIRVAIVVAAVAAVAAVVASAGSAAAPQQLEARLLRTYDAFDANQGVAIDQSHFYAVDNRQITKHDRKSSAPLLQFSSVSGAPMIHMDSGAIYRGKLYAAHVIPDDQTEPYGGTDNTQVVKLDDDFRVVAAYTIPQEILDRFKPMSNSGGSWGPDGRLWLTGHDLGEAYVVEPPKAGSELRWIATVTLPGVEGQGIAWDVSGHQPTLWTIKRSTKQVLQFSVPYRDIDEPPANDWHINGPGHFE